METTWILAGIAAIAFLVVIIPLLRRQDRLQQQVQKITGENGELRADLKNAQKQLDERGVMVKQLEEKFENVSNRVFKSQHSDFSEMYNKIFKHGKKSIEDVIGSLKPEISDNLQLSTLRVA